jgi:hypothetical protein
VVSRADESPLQARQCDFPNAQPLFTHCAQDADPSQHKTFLRLRGSSARPKRRPPPPRLRIRTSRQFLRSESVP